jgi:hypothetical protein
MQHDAAKPSLKRLKVFERMEMAKNLQEDLLRNVLRFTFPMDDAHRLHLNRSTVPTIDLGECLLVSLLSQGQPLKHLAAFHLLCTLDFHGFL